MRNIWIIWQKELRSYFVSPIAYLLLTMFALIFGFFFWNALGYFVMMGMESQMRGQPMPMNINEEVIRPLLSNIGVIGMFFVPMITMRLFAEEKRSGTIELLTTSPIRDMEVILGKWLAAVTLYASMLLLTALNLLFLFKYCILRFEAANELAYFLALRRQESVLPPLFFVVARRLHAFGLDGCEPFSRCLQFA